MKVAPVFILVASVAATAAGHSYNNHRHHLHYAKTPVCTIENESQCNGQNWSMSTCCKNLNYECRRDDFGQNVMRCQKKKSLLRNAHKTHEAEDEESLDNSDVESSDSADDLISIEDFSVLIRKQNLKGHALEKVWIPGLSCESDEDCKGNRPLCREYSNMGQICLPSEVPRGFICGENSPRWWRGGYCATGLACKPVGDGSQLRCT